MWTLLLFFLRFFFCYWFSSCVVAMIYSEFEEHMGRNTFAVSSGTVRPGNPVWGWCFWNPGWLWRHAVSILNQNQHRWRSGLSTAVLRYLLGWARIWVSVSVSIGAAFHQDLQEVTWYPCKLTNLSLDLPPHRRGRDVCTVSVPSQYSGKGNLFFFGAFLAFLCAEPEPIRVARQIDSL